MTRTQYTPSRFWSRRGRRCRMSGRVNSSAAPSGPLSSATGDKAGAVDTWLRGVGGSDYRPALDRALPRAFDEAVASADTFFGHELPAVQQWAFTQEDASRVT